MTATGSTLIYHSSAFIQFLPAGVLFGLVVESIEDALSVGVGADSASAVADHRFVAA